MGRHPVSDEYVIEAAERASIPTEDLNLLLGKVQDTLSKRIALMKHEAYYRGGANNHLFNFNDDYEVFATTLSDLMQFTLSEMNLSSDEVRAVAYAHTLELEATWNRTITVPGAIARSLEDPSHYALIIELSDGYKQGRLSAVCEFIQLAEYDLTPEEILDYWIGEEVSSDRLVDEWIAQRYDTYDEYGESRMAANEKRSDEERHDEITHPARNLTHVEIDDQRTYNRDELVEEMGDVDRVTMSPLSGDSEE